MDIFAKYMNLGKVESSGMVFNDTDRYYYLDEASYTGGDDPVAEAGPIGEQIPDCKESGKLSSVDIGVRLRVQF